MMFTSEHKPSLRPKIFVIVVLSLAVASGLLIPYNINGDQVHRIFMLSFAAIYMLRLSATLFVFLKRKMSWGEAVLISVVMSIILIVFFNYGRRQSSSINTADIIGIVLYLCGSCLNTFSEYQRYVWKKKPQNHGHLYTQGLFRLSMHINYFGDVVLFTGFALVTHNIVLLLIPLLMMLNFIVVLIPSLDEYLQSRYSGEFQEYANRTKKFIPGIY
jgi:protein-S-isoprenylcysteine O-methyltransferase Ste14